MKRAVFAFLFVCFLGFNVFGQEAKLMLPTRNNSGMTDAEFSPDGKRIVAAFNDGTAELWDAEKFTRIAELKDQNDQWDIDIITSEGNLVVPKACFSPDGKKIITMNHDGFCKVWDSKSGKVLLNLKDDPWVADPKFSPDGKTILTVGGSAHIWESNSGKLLVHIKEKGVYFLMAQFSKDAKYILTICSDSTAKIWDPTSGKKLFEVGGYKTGVSYAEFSLDSKQLLTVCSDTACRVWDVEKGKLIEVLKGHSKRIIASHFSTDSKKIITSSLDSTARIWDAKTGNSLLRLAKINDVLNNANFSPDGKKVFIHSQQRHIVQICDASTGKTLVSIDVGSYRPLDQILRDNVISENFSPDGARLMISGSEGENLFDVNSGKLLFDFAVGMQATDVVDALFSPDGKKIISICGNECHVWDKETGALLFDLKGHDKPINSVRFSNDGKKIVTASKDHTAKIWDSKTGKSLVTLAGDTSDIITTRFSADDSRIVTATLDNTLKIWNSQTAQLLSILKVGMLDSFAISPCGTKIVTVAQDNIVQVWESANGRLLLNLRGHKDVVNSAEFSGDGMEIVTAANDSTAKVWDATTGALIFSLKAANKNFYYAIFSPDGKTIATNSDENVSIWDALTGKLIYVLRETGNNFKFNPFVNDKIVTTSGDGMAKIWNPKTGNLLVDVKGNRHIVSDIQLSSDNKNLVIAAQDHTYKVFNASDGRMLYTSLAVDSNDYLITDPYGRYDGTEAARKLLYFTCGTEVIGLDQVKDQLWVPNLAERIMKGDSINAKKLSDLDICGLIPEVEKENKSGYHFMITPQRGGLGETVVYVNGIEEKRYHSSQLTNTTTGYELNVEEKDLAPYFITGQQNPVTVKAFTANNDISSRGAVIVQDGTKKKSVAPNLYAVMIGVSDYKGPELQLKYAAKDAEDISAAISASAKKLLDTTGGKEHVFMYNLTTGKNHYELPEKIAIKNLFGEIGKKATANDILLIFFAGHGVTSGEKKQFYFLTADASQASATDAPDQVGISTKELSEWMQPSNIKAQKRILILDACNSGQAINELIKVGAYGQNYLAARNDDKAEQIKAIDKLNEKSGLFILAASASNQSAYEMGRYSQGLLTYSLLKAIKQQPDILEDNKYLNVSRWFNAAEKNVSDMVRETGNRQEPQIVSAGNFNIGVVDQQVMAGIRLADEKPLFTASNLQNNDPDIAADDLHLNSFLDSQLNEISARGENDGITYIPGSTSPDAYSLGGRYILNGGLLTIKVNIRQNDVTKYKFELTDKKDDLKALAEKVVKQATDLILKK